MSIRIVEINRPGFMLTETLVGLVILGLLAGAAARLVTDYYRMENREVRRRAAAWAADAQLQRYHAGVPIDTLPPLGLIPSEITLATATEPGRGQWRGLTRVTVTATFSVPPRMQVRETVSGYVRTEGKR